MGKTVPVPIAESLRFMTECLVTAGAGTTPAKQQADQLITADKIGYFSHGLNRLEKYVNDILSGACQPNNTPKILKENRSTAWVDANNVLGATTSHFGMDVAIKKAKNTGVGWVAVKGSNHHGITGFWAKKAADRGLIGLAFTNSSPLMAPTRSRQAACGTNPIALVTHVSNKDTFYMDISTTAVSMGKIEMQVRKGEPLPPGWAQGPDGLETTNAKLANSTRCLMPLGGGESTSGYKGFALAAMVELFTGISIGSKYAHHVRSWTSWTTKGTEGPADLGHCFIAVDPQNFAPGYSDRLGDLLQGLRKLTPSDPKLPVLVPGDKEREFQKKTLKRGTILYVEQLLRSCERLAERLNVKPIKIGMTEQHG